MKDLLKRSDSTELLLDAMCNIFGVVLLIAIIIGGMSISEKLSSPDKVNRELLLQSQRKHLLLNTELKAVQSHRKLLESLLKKDTHTNTVYAIDKTLQKKHLDLLKQVNTLADRIEKVYRQLAEEKLLNAKLKNSDLEQEKKRIARLKEALQKKTVHKKARFYTSSDTSLMPWRLLLDKDHIYIIGANKDIYRGSSEQTAVDISTFKQGSHRFFRIRKRSGKGIHLKDLTLQSLQLPATGKSRYFVEILCEENAITQLAKVIEFLRKNDLFFAWKTIPPTGAVLRTAERGNYEVTR